MLYSESPHCELLLYCNIIKSIIVFTLFYNLHYFIILTLLCPSVVLRLMAVFIITGKFIGTLAPADEVTVWLNPSGGVYMMTCHPNANPKLKNRLDL